MNELYTHIKYVIFLCINIKSCYYVFEPSLVVVLKNTSLCVCHTSLLTHDCHGLKYMNICECINLCTLINAWCIFVSIKHKM